MSILIISLIFITVSSNNPFFFFFNFLVFRSLLQTLTDALCKALGKDELSLKSKVLSLTYSHDGKSTLQNWSLYNSNQDKQSQGLSFDAVIMTVGISFI